MLQDLENDKGYPNLPKAYHLYNSFFFRSGKSFL